jgi:hypothetical protein
MILTRYCKLEFEITGMYQQALERRFFSLRFFYRWAQ